MWNWLPTVANPCCGPRKAGAAREEDGAAAGVLRVLFWDGLDRAGSCAGYRDSDVAWIVGGMDRNRHSRASGLCGLVPVPGGARTGLGSAGDLAAAGGFADLSPGGGPDPAVVRRVLPLHH